MMKETKKDHLSKIALIGVCVVGIGNFAYTAANKPSNDISVQIAGELIKNNQLITNAAAKEFIGKTAAQYIIDNPQVLVTASQKLEEKESQINVQKIVDSKDALLDDKVTPYAGRKDAKVVVIEFFDYNCHFCQNVTPTMKKLISNNTEIKFLFKEFPIFGQGSEAAAQMGLHSYNIGGVEGYQKYHEAMFSYAASKQAKDHTGTNISDAVSVAEQAGITSVISPEERQQYSMVVQTNQRLASNLNIKGTPAFIIMPSENPLAEQVITIPGAASYERLQKAINDVETKVRRN